MDRPEDSAPRMRLDKWLWAVRFFKTRQLAAEAIRGGRVHLNGQRTKPGKDICIGSQIQISKSGLEWEVEVLQLPRQRRPAVEAQQAYAETAHSLEQRAQRLEERRVLRETAGAVAANHRPNKRERRLIHRFKRSD